MASVKARVKPEILVWARRSAGLTIEAVAKRAQVQPQQVESWEAGDDQPTVVQLRKVAHAFKQSISTFYLPKAPKDLDIPKDFRRLPGEPVPQYSPALRLEIRRAYQRRELALDLFREIGEEPLRFTPRASLSDDPEAVGQKIRTALKVEYSEQIKWRQPYESYRAWRQKIENIAILVFQASGISTREMRGFSIPETLLPVIAANVKDKANARTFSVLHEFVHLMLRTSGLCDLHEEPGRPREEHKVEIFCNRVAAAALVPKDRLLNESVVAARGSRVTIWENDILDSLSRRYGVSQEVILLRLLTLGRTTEDFYWNKRQEYVAIYKALEEEEKERRGEYRRNLPQEAVSNYGRPFVRLILNSYYQDRITLTDAAMYLGIRARQLLDVEEMVGA